MAHGRSTVIVTGAAGNLGRAVVQAFAAQGANLVLLNRHPERLADLFGPDGEQQLSIGVDLLVQSEVDRAVQLAVERFGRVQVLCNLSGGFRMGSPVHETSDDDLTFLFDINVRTLVHTVRAVVPHMLASGGGRVVNVAAFAAQRGGANMGAYSAAKSAVIRLTEAMAAELREHNINVNCVLPTVIDTPENRAAMPNVDPARWVAPRDLAAAIVFLASEDARAIHGAAIPVTGLS